MNASELVSRYNANAEYTRQYFDLCIQALNDLLRQYERETIRQLEIGLLESSVYLTRILERGVKEDEAGRPQSYRYSSTLSKVRLFPNQPAGWLVGEIQHLHRFALLPKRFARSFVTDDNGRTNLKVFGYSLPLESTSADDFAIAIFRILTEPSIFEADLVLYEPVSNDRG